ncbi:MAG: glycosyltransferase family 1 protein [Candidatus Peregrinibacteria bacterium]
MKIGINARFLTHPYTGIGQYTRYLLQALGQADLKNEYFLFTPELVEVDLPDHFHQIRIREAASYSPGWAKAHWEHTLVPQEMKKEKMDLAHFFYPSNPWVRLSIPTVVTVHDAIPWRLPAYRQRLRSKLYHFYTRLALKKADHLITPSQFSKQEIHHLFKIQDKNITVIPHGLPMYSTLLKPPAVPLRRDFLLYVGGYDDRKNVPRLMEAFLKHVANTHAVDLILVGGKGKGLESLITGEYAEWVTPAIPVQPKGQIFFTGPLESHELAALYGQAKALVHPSFYEGFNLPLVEAMNAGAPIIAADIPVNREVTGGAGLFFDPHSTDAIGQTILKFLSDRRLQQDLAKQGREKAQEYSWKKSAEETLNVYNLFT